MIPAVITGVGPVTAIGCGQAAYWDALIAGKSGVGPITACDVSRSPSRIGAEIRGFRLADFVARGTELARMSTRPVQLALAAASLAIGDASMDLAAADTDRMGVFVGTSVASLGDAFRARDEWLASPGRLAPDKAFHLFNHSAACSISAVFDLRGPSHTLSEGCNSGLDALAFAARSIQSGRMDAALVVGTDCELVPEILAALNASRSLSTRYNDAPELASRPFDRDRDGTVVGEGAAALWLESEALALRRRARVYARFAGYANCSAGRQRRYNPVAPEMDTRPCVRAFQEAMREAGWTSDDVDLVNANGSSSVFYDRLEAGALAEAFGPRFPELRVHSIKSMLGQHGAGSSALQAVAACLSLHRQAAPPTINCDCPDPGCGPIRISTRPEPCALHRVLIHSIGLGGFYYSCGALESP